MRVRTVILLREATVAESASTCPLLVALDFSSIDAMALIHISSALLDRHVFL